MTADFEVRVLRRDSQLEMLRGGKKVGGLPQTAVLLKVHTDESMFRNLAYGPAVTLSGTKRAARHCIAAALS